MILKKYFKDSNATVDFVFDFAGLRNSTGYKDYLEYGETISSAVAISSSADLVITATNVIKNDTAVQVWLTGGVAGVVYTLTARITTSLNRIDDRSISIQVDNL
jgi:small ligand-binding sensory domain FIST